ncbi:MAG: trypsin-like peptidase domain-containing protein, partial [Planctomycetota bacterium]
MRTEIVPWLLAAASVAAITLANPSAQPAAEPAQLLKSPTGEITLAPLLEKVSPSVVSIGVKGRVQARGLAPLFGSQFRDDRTAGRSFTSAGSGVIVDGANGYIVTNNHVVRNADDIQVTLQDGRELPAEIVGTDEDGDLAVIRVQANDLKSIPLGDSDSLRVGDFVVAIGNPFGLNGTATYGIVSALGRHGFGAAAYESFIQTDASINPGNSGGALVNLRGELVGINTAIIGPSGGNVGIGFAIPARMAQQAMRGLIDHGSVQRGQLGIMISDIDAGMRQELGLASDRGVIIRKVVDGSGAARAGLEPN